MRFIRFQAADIFGMAKNVANTAGHLGKAVDDQCVFDGSVIDVFVR